MWPFGCSSNGQRMSLPHLFWIIMLAKIALRKANVYKGHIWGFPLSSWNLNMYPSLLNTFCAKQVSHSSPGTVTVSSSKAVSLATVRGAMFCGPAARFGHVRRSHSLNLRMRGWGFAPCAFVAKAQVLIVRRAKPAGRVGGLIPLAKPVRPGRMAAIPWLPPRLSGTATSRLSIRVISRA